MIFNKSHKGTAMIFKKLHRGAMRIALLCASAVGTVAFAENAAPLIALSKDVKINEKPLILKIAADQPGHPINKTQYGVFFEEISHAGQGGLYAELINNRSFEDSPNSIPEWNFYTTGAARGSIALETSNLLNAAQARALRLDVAAAETVGVANGGTGITTTPPRHRSGLRHRQRLSRRMH